MKTMNLIEAEKFLSGIVKFAETIIVSLPSGRELTVELVPAGPNFTGLPTFDRKFSGIPEGEIQFWKTWLHGRVPNDEEVESALATLPAADREYLAEELNAYVPEPADGCRLTEQGCDRRAIYLAAAELLK